MDEDLRDLVRASVRSALESSSRPIGDALADFGWAELAQTDEQFAFTTLFETQGMLGAETDALDVVTAATVGLDAPARVLWPLVSPVPDGSGEVEVVVHGVALGHVSGAQLLAPIGGELVTVVPDDVTESPAGGMAASAGWVRVQVRGVAEGAVAPWATVERRAWLATGSELVGIAQRILDVAAEQVSQRKQFGQPIAVNQAVRHKLAEAYAETVGARAIVARAWEDGTSDAAAWARVVAATSADVVGKHAMQVCGAIGLSEEHEVPRLVKRAFSIDALCRPSVTAAVGRRFLAGEAVAPVGGF